MDQGRSKGGGEVLDHVVEGVDENLNHLVEGVAIDAEAVGRLSERDSASGEDGTSEEMCNDLGLNKELKEGEGPQEVKGHDTGDQQKSDDILHVVDQGTSYNSGNLVNGEVLETCVVIDSSAQIEHVNVDNRKLEVKVNESGLSKVPMKAQKGMSEKDKNSCVIDIKCGSCKGFSENLEGEMICRICHLASGQPLEATAVGTANGAASTDLIQLGCSCKDELGIAHSHCAEAWFRLKGNRSCEICGETAKNVSGITDNGFIEEWNESRFVDSRTATSSSMFGRCWRGQPFCNFLMACLVIAFVLPWFFRVNMF